MSRPPRWIVIPAVAALTLAASIITASARAPQGATAPAAGAQETLTQKANREAAGQAPRGPWAYSGASGYTNYLGGGVGRSPAQPINFPHPVHVNTLKLNCVYCHFSAFKSPDPGMPAVGTCIGCHQNPAILPNSEELKKLKDFAAKNQPVPWVRVHKVPEYVHFPHMRHVNAGVTCQSCHGRVQNMPQVFQYASLNMGWCVSCHVKGYSLADGLRAAGYTPDSAALAAPRKRATYDCSNCHF